MSDVVRGAKALVVALANDEEGGSESGEEEGGSESGGEEDELVYRLLTSWAQSIWTFPELLISRGKSLTWYLPRFGEEEEEEEEQEEEEPVHCTCTTA